jgi:hypothetical protein
MFANLARGSVGTWTIPSSLEAMKKRMHLDLDERFLEKRQFSAAFISFDISKDYVRQMIVKWAELSLIREIIGPEEASRANPRFDQAVLSLLLHRSDIDRLRSRRVYPQALLGFDIHQDID